MHGLTTIERMRLAVQHYRIDQPDDYTIVIYGPDNFYELHDSYAAAYERKEELGLLAAMKAISLPPNAIADASKIGLKNEQAELVWQAFVGAIVEEYQSSRCRREDCPDSLPRTPQTVGQ